MSEILSRASFEQVRYAQVWEDADVLLAALDVQPGDTVLSICSAGDNALALLTTDAARVVALVVRVGDRRRTGIRSGRVRATAVPATRAAAARARCSWPGSTSRTRSTSASVLVRPNENRMAPRASSSGTRRARSTCDGSGTPAAQPIAAVAGPIRV